MTGSKIITGSRMGTKALCGVINDDGDAVPLLATDNGDGTGTLKVDTEVSVAIDPGTLSTASNQVLTNAAIGGPTDAAASDTVDESATSRTVVGLLKGSKNLLIDLAGCIIAGVSKTCGYNQVVRSGTTAGPASASGAYSTYDRIGPATGSAASTIANMALANGRGGTITMLRLTCNKKSVTPVIRVHFFNDSAPTVAADNAQWKEVYADISKRIGYYDMPAMSTGADTASSDCSRTQDMDVRIPYLCGASSTSIYFALELIGGSLTLDNNTEFTLVAKAVLN